MESGDRKRLFLCGLFGALSVGCSASAAIELKGILQLGDQKLAIMRAEGPRSRQYYFLREGQREGPIEVQNIDLESGKVRIKEQSAGVSEVRFDSYQPLGAPIRLGPDAQAHAAKNRLRLEEAGTDIILNLYQNYLAHRTLIRPTALPQVKVSLYCEQPVTTADLANAVEKAMAEQRVPLTKEGDKLVVALGQEQSARVIAEVRQATITLCQQSSNSPAGTTPSSGDSSASPPEEILPAGVINFPATDLNQVLVIYQELLNRTVLRPMALPSPVIMLKTATPLTKCETVFVFAATLAVNGISVRPVTDKFVFVFPSSLTNRLDALLVRKPARSEGDNPTVPARTGNFNMGIDQVLRLYSDLSGQSVKNGIAWDGFFIFRTETPLTKSEALYALDLLLGWEGFEVVASHGGNGLQLVRIKQP